MPIGLRIERSDNAAFRAAANDLGAMLIYEASRDLEVEHFDTKTPVAMAEIEDTDDQLAHALERLT